MLQLQKDTYKLSKLEIFSGRVGFSREKLSQCVKLGREHYARYILLPVSGSSRKEKPSLVLSVFLL